MRCLVGALLVLLLPTIAAAQPCPIPLPWPFAEISVSPSEPAVGETVTITVWGEHNDLCWSVPNFDCGDLVGQALTITVNSYDCANRECPICDLATSPFEVTCEYVFSAPGEYVIRADENADTTRWYCGTDVEHAIQVSGSVPVAGSSWGAIKALFR